MACVNQDDSETMHTETVFVKVEPQWDNEASEDAGENYSVTFEPEIEIKVEPYDVETDVTSIEGSAPCPPPLNGWEPTVTSGEQLAQSDPPPTAHPPPTEVPPPTKVPPKRPKRKDMSCDVCKREFNRTALLIRHKRIHTGEKPYSCEVCTKRFTHLSAFNRHRRNHTGEKPYSCELCEKQFTEMHNYVTHKRIHTGERPYVCEVCKKSFVKSTDLNKHKRVHTGEKPFTCDVCQKSFSCSGNLIKHKRTHTGEKRHCCEFCDKQFTKRIYLEKHRLVHGEEKPQLAATDGAARKHPFPVLLSHMSSPHRGPIKSSPPRKQL